MVADGDAASVLQTTKRDLDAVASLVSAPVVSHSLAAGLSSRDARSDTLVFQRFAEPVGVVAPVGDQPLDRRQRPAQCPRADVDDTSPRRIKDLLSLALLAPPLLETIAKGTQPPALTTDYLVKTGLPPLWEDQIKHIAKLQDLAAAEIDADASTSHQAAGAAPPSRSDQRYSDTAIQRDTTVSAHSASANSYRAFPKLRRRPTSGQI